MPPRRPQDLTSYLRLARREHGSVWRLLVGILVGAAGFLVVTLGALLLVAAVLWAFGQRLGLSGGRITPQLLLATNLGLAACIPLAALLYRWLHGLRPRWLSSVAPGLRGRWLGACLLVTGVIWGALLLLALLAIVASGRARTDTRAWLLLAVVVLTTPLQAAGEEYLFRGFLLQSLGATGLAAPVCWVLSGAAFAAAHLQFDPPLFLDRLLIGVVFAWIATVTGGLEASVAMHAAKNMSVLIPAALLGRVSRAVDPGNVSWVPLILDAVTLAVAVVWMRVWYRRHRLPPPPTELAPLGARVG